MLDNKQGTDLPFTKPPDAKCPAHAPADHPKVPPQKVGILLANLGTPDNYDYWSMRRYLNEFLSDRRVIDYAPWKWQPLLQLIILTKRPFSSGAAYKSIWNEEKGESPLMTITRDQTAAIRDKMVEVFGDKVEVDFCMRYGNPSTKAKVQEMVDKGCQKILFFPLYPHYAGATSATANDQFFRALFQQVNCQCVAIKLRDQRVFQCGHARIERAQTKRRRTVTIRVVGLSQGGHPRALQGGDVFLHCVELVANGAQVRYGACAVCAQAVGATFQGDNLGIQVRGLAGARRLRRLQCGKL